MAKKISKEKLKEDYHNCAVDDLDPLVEQGGWVERVECDNCGKVGYREVDLQGIFS